MTNTVFPFTNTDKSKNKYIIIYYTQLNMDWFVVFTKNALHDCLTIRKQMHNDVLFISGP